MACREASNASAARPVFHALSTRLAKMNEGIASGQNRMRAAIAQPQFADGLSWGGPAGVGYPYPGGGLYPGGGP